MFDHSIGSYGSGLDLTLRNSDSRHSQFLRPSVFMSWLTRVFDFGVKMGNSLK